MKGYELIRKIGNGEIKENTQFYVYSNKKLCFGNPVIYKNQELISDKTSMTRFLTLKNISDLEYELIEENKEIEEYKTEYTERRIDIEVRNKINELVRAVNKLIKESEGK